MGNIYAKLLDQINQGLPVSMVTEIDTSTDKVSTGIKRSLEAPETLYDAKGRKYTTVTYTKTDGKITVKEPQFPAERLIVLGGGHIALPLCEFAAKSGFSVYVCDDRPAFANHQRFPWVEDVICDTFENAIAKLKITAFDYVVVITRGHKHDANCLRAIYPGTFPAYLGLIGSRRRVKGLIQMLIDEGHDSEFFDKICTPIGLSIGAISPSEIAISIIAELIAYKRLPEHSGSGIRCCNDSDIEQYVLEYLAENHDPKAVVTVIQAKGSTPRSVGAKMSVSPIGQITGSIGGGCSESAVIHDAIHIIGTGTYKIIDIDLTGDVAESEGMVCGGIMKVLVEDGSDL